MKVGIDHVAIYSKDTKKLKEWYEELFGFKTVDDNGKGNYFLRADDDSMIEFVVADDNAKSTSTGYIGVVHIALSVNDFDQMYQRLLKWKVKTVKPVSVSDTGVKTYFFEDPEGNILHLITRKNPF